MNLWLWFVILIPSVVLHEVAHGYVAYLFGDPTAKERHRLTLNPLAHVDPFGTVLMPALLLLTHFPAFGYAKPVPVNISRLRKPRQDALWVSLAGPAVNVVLSAVGYVICRFAIHGIVVSGGIVDVYESNHDLFVFGETMGLVNLVLAVFNLIPIPPLDGSAIIERFLPRRSLAKYYQLRARALPVFFIALILLFWFTNVADTWIGDLENWWFRLL
ncbi:MAG: site-2 protease family protein [Acidimicrobiales bacterium]